MKRKIDFITIIACALVVSILSVMFFVLPDRKMSNAENRALMNLPQFSGDKFLSGEYTADLGKYISDQFPARDAFVAIKAYSELALGKGENNGVVYGKNNTLIAKNEKGDRLQENLSAIKEFENAIDIPVSLCVLPSSADVFAENLPKSYNTKQDKTLWQNFYSIAKSFNLTVCDLYNPLCEQNNYYRTDHHYTSFGAYQTYGLLADTIGYTPKTMDYFNCETVSTDFCGTSMRTSAFYLVPKDEITLFRYTDDTDYIVTADGKQTNLYDFSKLKTADQYAVFLGGNHARVDISSTKEKPKMLVIRDSFADCLAPFLAIHYDLTLIDLRYYSDNIQQLLSDENFDRVLILECMTEFSTTKNLSYLRMAAKK